MIRVTRRMALDEGELDWSFVRAGGPGGQHVNKASTAVQLRFDAAGSANVPDEMLGRLKRVAGRRMTADGVVVIEARRYRSRERNRQDALDRLVKLLRRASQRPKKRRKTKPTRASKQRRLEEKRRRGRTKKLRRRVRRPENQ